MAVPQRLVSAERNHNLIVGNLFVAFHSQLRRRPCRIYPSDMRVKAERGGLYTYPDVVVVSGRRSSTTARSSRWPSIC